MDTLQVLKGFNAVAGRIYPQLPASLARKLLMTPRRHTPKEWELPALDTAQRVTFRFGLSGLRWGGEGPVVLMLHGWEGRPTQFRHFIEPLVAAGRQVIALDGPAHGESEGSESNPIDFAMALQEAAVEIRNLESVVGHSMGAGAITYALANGLPAERAVLIAAPARLTDVLQQFSGALNLPPRAHRRFIDIVNRRAGVPADEVTVERMAPRLRVPALVVHDRDDRQVPFDAGRVIAEYWPGAQLLETHGLGHQRILTDPAVVREVAAFLTGTRTEQPLAA